MQKAEDKEKVKNLNIFVCLPREEDTAKIKMKSRILMNELKRMMEFRASEH